MAVIKRSDIVRKNKKPNVLKVMVPQWAKNGFVYVRALRASEIDDIQKIAESTNGKMSTAKSLVDWCILGACDAKGKRIFKESDADSLLAGSLMPVQDVVTKFMQLNGITEDDAAKN